MLDSLRAQDHQDWEAVFVDDGSEDETPSILEQAADFDERVVLASLRATVGKAAAFNLAYSRCSGEVITLLAGDDRLPPDSLSRRARDMASELDKKTLAAYKLRTFSDERSMDGMLLPKGDAVSYSGASLTMSHSLAELLFPIPPELPSEDLWLGYAAPSVADHVIENPVAIMDYRIHAGNSNPRQQNFTVMGERMAERHRAWALLADSALPLPPQERDHLRALWAAEKHRASGDTLAIFRSRGLGWAERASLAAMSDPRLWWLRQRFYRVLSGWQGR